MKRITLILIAGVFSLYFWTAGFAQTNTQPTIGADLPRPELTNNYEFPSRIGRDSNGIVRHLTIGQKPEEERSLPLINRIDSLQSLKFLGTPPEVVEAGIHLATANHNLTNLQFACFLSRGLPAGVLKQACEMTQLRRLSIYYSRPPTEEFVHLANLTNLTSLSITACTNFNDAHLELIGKLPQLENLTIQETSVTRAGTNTLSATHPSLNISYRR